MEIFRADTIDSTYIEAERRSTSLGDGEYLFLAREQTAGRGRGTHSFLSQRDNGIYATLLLKGSLVSGISPRFASRLTPFCAVCVTQSVNRICSDFSERLGVKWINDLLLDGKKYGGILSSVTVCGGTLDSIRFGIGINTGYATMPDELRDKVTTLGLDGRDSERLTLDIASTIASRIKSIDDDEIYDEYIEYCTTPGKSVMLPDGRCGRAVSVEKDFSLLVTVEGRAPEYLKSTAGLIIF